MEPNPIPMPPGDRSAPGLRHTGPSPGAPQLALSWSEEDIENRIGLFKAGRYTSPNKLLGLVAAVLLTGGFFGAVVYLYSAFGANPWGMLAGQVTLSPVKADPFFGHCEISKASLKKSRIYLEVGALAPELAARVTVNGKDAGGFIGKPARLEVTSHLKAGPNTLRIEPFAPASVRLVVCPKFGD